MNRQGPFLAVLQTVKGNVSWLIGLFSLTEEDRLKAWHRSRRRGA